MTSLSFSPVSAASHSYSPLTSGRPSITMAEAELLLVNDSQFAGSTTRGEIWTKLLEYLGLFVALEVKFKNELRGDSLLSHMWLGGSFVSDKTDPRNLDLTLFVDVVARNKIKGLPGAGTLTKLISMSRDSALRKYLVSPIFVNYHKVPHLFDRSQFTTDEAEYFLERGRWDDWWQRVRTGSDPAPTFESCSPRRGYLEVKLR